MKRNFLTSVLVVAAILGTVEAAPVAAGVKLQYNLKPGEKDVYRVITEAKTAVFVGDREQHTSMQTEMIFTQRVIDVSKDGVITLLTSIDSGSITLNRKRSPLPNIGQKVVVDMKRDGEITGNSQYQLINLKNFQLVFPERELSIGDSWVNRIEPSVQVPVPLEVEYKILNFEKVKGYDCVKIASKVRSKGETTITGLGLNVKADGIIYFAYKEGKLIKNEVKSSLRMILKRVINNKPEQIITKISFNLRMEIQY